MINLLVLQATGPRIQLEPRTNMTISGTANTITTRSATARLIIIKLVTDCRILESLTMTAMTSMLPATPMKKMVEKRSKRRTVPWTELSSPPRDVKLLLTSGRPCWDRRVVVVLMRDVGTVSASMPAGWTLIS